MQQDGRKTGGKEQMKAISLWLPWAQFIALKLKKIETRSWNAPDYLIGQRIAIHATAKMPGWVKKLLRGFAKLIGIEEYNGSWLYYLENGVGPFGKVVATAKLVACEKIISDEKYHHMACLKSGRDIVGNEYHFGDYTPGRYAWILDDIQALPEPVPAKGMQGLWEWKEDKQ
jgi:hypothetical protein